MAMTDPAPPNCTFQPTDHEILYFLTLKISDPTFALAHLGERLLYAPDASWDFHQDFAVYTAGPVLHFFTPLANGSPDADRVVANGSWKFECTFEIYDPDGRLMAFRKLFTFCDTDDKPTGFRMYEFTLAANQAMALCVIKRVNSAATSPSHSRLRSPITYIPSAATLNRQRAATLKRQQMAR